MSKFLTKNVDPMFTVFANHNSNNDPHVQSNRCFKGNQKYLKKNLTTTFEVIDAIEIKTIKEVL